MKTKWWMFALMLASISWVACDDDDDNGDNNRSLNDADKTFVEKAAASNMAEVELGGLAASNGMDSLVRAFGQQMVTAHTEAQQELKDIADDFDNVDWPEDLDDQHQQVMDQLDTLSGYSFDSLYIATQVMDHQTAVDLFENESTDGTEQMVKAYADKYLPAIDMHLDRADSIKTAITMNQGQ